VHEGNIFVRPEGQVVLADAAATHREMSAMRTGSPFSCSPEGDVTAASRLLLDLLDPDGSAELRKILGAAVAPSLSSAATLSRRLEHFAEEGTTALSRAVRAWEEQDRGMRWASDRF
jgi:hypothetical protein